MKNKILTFLLLLPILSIAQWKSFSFKAGVYTPYDLKNGAIYGIDYGTILNENITFLISGDLYYRSIRNDSYLNNEEKLGVKIRTGQKLNEWVGWHLPITAKLRVEFPMDRAPVSPFVVGGIGYGLTRISYESYNSFSNESETISLTYNGFVWQVGGGILYRIGPNSSLMLEIIHNAAYFEKEEKYNQFTSLNSSGVIMRIGIDFAFR
ncbi:MAG: outer membrane beta-barrel protein [Ignavibacteriales bacterium]|nr:outer membrane beta-barrel protein [Ignavibacteriales bacterium]